MITDKLTSFGFPVALNTGAAGSYLLGDVIPLDVARDLGNSTQLYLVISCAVTAASAGAATATFKLVTDAQAAINPTTATVHAQSPAIPVASMVAGKSLFVIALPLEGNAYETFMGIVQVTGTAAFTAGSVHAFLTPTPPAWKAYAEGAN